MTPYLAIARTTARQVIGGKRFIGFALLIVGPAGILWLATTSRTGFAALETFIGITVGTFFVVVVPVVAVMLATTALGADRRDGTIAFITLRPLHRPLTALAKIVGSAATAFALTGSGALALGLVAAWRVDDAGYIVPLLVATALATLAYCAVLVPLGFITERAALIGLAYVFVWESAIAGTIGALAWTSLWRVGFLAFAAMVPSEASSLIPEFTVGTMDAGVGVALTRTLVLVALGSVATGWLLRSRDLA